jgi:hypothetical protein
MMSRRVITALWVAALVLADSRAAAAAPPAAAPPAATPVAGAGAPPPILLLVRQEIRPDQESSRANLEREMASAFDRLGTPIAWIATQSVTGRREALFLDPASSYGALDAAGATLASTFAAHPELARLQERIRGTIASERTVLAQRRDDLGYRRESVDLSRARYLRVNSFFLRPGHDGAFEEIARIRAAAYEKANADVPWVVYQVNAGTENQAFLVLLTLRSLGEYDSLALVGAAIQRAQGDEATRRLMEIERDALDRTHSELYAIDPAMSHVPAEFAAADTFWRPPAPSRAAKPATGRTPARHTK